MLVGPRMLTFCYWRSLIVLLLLLVIPVAALVTSLPRSGPTNFSLVNWFACQLDLGHPVCFE